MKRRIIRAANSASYPAEYLKLQRALQEVRHLIDECVDAGLEDYAAWDEISKGLFDGIQAISNACRDADEAVNASTSATSGTYRSFIQFDETFAEIPADAWYLAIRMPLADYQQLSEEVKDTLGDMALTRGEDEEGYIYIDIEDRIDLANSEGVALLNDADICKTSKKYEVIQYTEVWS